jgi:hypothetical protein
MEASFKILKDQGKSELLEILDSLRGRKCLVLEPSFKRLLVETVFEGDTALKDSDVHQYDINESNLLTSFESVGKELGLGLALRLLLGLSLLSLTLSLLRSPTLTLMLSHSHSHFLPQDVICQIMFAI